MTSEIAGDVRAYLLRLAATQAELVQVSGRKRAALRSANARVILELAAVETELAGRLRQHVVERQQLVERGRSLGWPCQTIEQIVDRLPDDGGELRRRIEACRRVSSRLQREAWVHWIVARRAASHNEGMRELIAHHGRRSPTYDTPVGSALDRAAPGGAVLDASA